MTDDAITPVDPPAQDYPSLLADLQSRLTLTRQLPAHDSTAPAEPCARAQKKERNPKLQKAIDAIAKALKLSTLKTNKAPVPRHIWYVWVGGEMPQEYADRIAGVVRNNPDWTVKVLLSGTLSASMEAFQTNRDKVSAAGAMAVPLEGPLANKLKREGMLDPLIWEWKTTASPDNIINYGAISDILRVFLLKEEGGMYNDTDNTITTPLPGKIVPKYGFLYGAFGSGAAQAEAESEQSFDENPDAYTALWNDGKPSTFRNKPYALSNSVLLTVPQGQVINAYWDHIKGRYTPQVGKSDDERFAALRWPESAGSQHAQREAMKMKTLHNTGPGALESTLGTMTIKGENALDLVKPPYGYDVHTNNGKDLLLDPKYVYVRSDNSWVKAIDQARGGAGQ